MLLFSSISSVTVGLIHVDMIDTIVTMTIFTDSNIWWQYDRVGLIDGMSRAVENWKCLFLSFFLFLFWGAGKEAADLHQL